MKRIFCAICGSRQKTEILYKANFSTKKISAKIFSARKIPDGIHYRLNKCLVCGLVFSSPILSPGKIAEFYVKSKFTYFEQTPYTAETYVNYFEKYFLTLPKKAKSLDVGCGHGFFLSALEQTGFKNVFGVEPSRDAFLKAPKHLSGRIKRDILRENTFQKNSFDVISCFQTLDHIVDPNKFLRVVDKLLKKSGNVLFVVHDNNGLSVKLFGEKSPIFAIGHIFLFNKKTLALIFRKNGFSQIQIFDVKNKYPFIYWLSMVPVPNALKNFLIRVLKILGMEKILITLGAGNIGIVAHK